jgi:uncharacterized protein YigA (DUF484 family)
MSSGTSEQACQEGSIEAADVEAYLRRHPDFFERNLELLEVLKVPHPCGGAVSLISRQIERLRDKNRRLQLQLNDIVQIARDNDNLHQRTHQLTLTLLDAVTVEDALGGLKWGLHQYFQADFVAVRLFGPRFETPLANLYMARDSAAVDALAVFLESGQPCCGRPDAEQAILLFGRDAPEVLSHALVPLQHAGLRGLLAIGSRDPERFQPGLGFLFLTQLGEVVSARLAGLLHGLV